MNLYDQIVMYYFLLKQTVITEINQCRRKLFDFRGQKWNERSERV